MQYPVYVEKQWLKLMWIILPIANLIFLTSQLKMGMHWEHPVRLALPLITILMLILMGKLTITVDDIYLRWSFGFLSLPAWKVALADIAAVEATQTKFFDGYGIKVTSQGMLYNAAGSAAIRVLKRNGKSFRLGTQDPQRLLSYISPRINVKSV